AMMNARVPPLSSRQWLSIGRLMSSDSGWRLRKKQLTVHLLRRFLRLDAKLTLEDVDAELILAQRGSPPTLAYVETHERAMRNLLQRVQARQSECGMNGRLDGTELHAARKQPREHPEREFVEPIALGTQPLLELCRARADAFQQVSLV